jgi:MFS family permease
MVADLFGREDLSGLAQSSQVFGSALLAVPATALAVSYGRRIGLGVGYGLGALGAALTVVATQHHLLSLVFVGIALIGGATAAGLQARYAATDLATHATRGRMLSVVVWSTTVGAVIGPNLAAAAGDVARRIGVEPLAGPFLLSAIVMSIGALIIIFGLRPDPLITARQLGSDMAQRRHGVLRAGWTAIAGAPPALLGLAAVATAHTVMMMVMTMTPVHMAHGGASISIIGFVISVHIAGMYAFSPVMGWLTDRLGRIPVILGAVVILLAAVTLAGTAREGHSLTLTAGLFLLGLGWSASIVAGSTLLTDVVEPSDRPVAQGAADLIMGLVAAGGSAFAGVVVRAYGYGVLNVAAAVLLTIPLTIMVIPACRSISNIRSA